MKKILCTLVILANLVVVAFAQADDWNHIQLASRDGHKILIDYQVNEYTYSLGRVATANPIWINNTGPNLGPNHQVRVVFMNIGDGRSSSDPSTEVHALDLSYQEQGRFSGSIPYGLKTSVIGHRQELAVVVNGAWLKDFSSGQSNFQLNLYGSR